MASRSNPHASGKPRSRSNSRGPENGGLNTKGSLSKISQESLNELETTLEKANDKLFELAFEVSCAVNAFKVRLPDYKHPIEINAEWVSTYAKTPVYPGDRPVFDQSGLLVMLEARSKAREEQKKAAVDYDKAKKEHDAAVVELDAKRSKNVGA